MNPPARAPPDLNSQSCLHHRHTHPLSPEWIHAITILLGHPWTSEPGNTHPEMDHLPSKPYLHQICFQMGSHTV